MNQGAKSDDVLEADQHGRPFLGDTWEGADKRRQQSLEWDLFSPEVSRPTKREQEMRRYLIQQRVPEEEEFNRVIQVTGSGFSLKMTRKAGKQHPPPHFYRPAN